MFRTCPLPMITDDSREWLRRHAHYRNHILSQAGGIDDQPAAYMAAMEAIESHG